MEEKPFRWDRDAIMRALNSSNVKRAEFVADVEVALAAHDTHTHTHTHTHTQNGTG